MSEFERGYKEGKYTATKMIISQLNFIADSALLTSYSTRSISGQALYSAIRKLISQYAFIQSEENKE